MKKYKCKICGRELKDPVSIKRKMGKSCYKKYLEKIKEKRRKLI